MAADTTTAGDLDEAVDWKGTARYEVARRIGVGGMGAVYEAFDRVRRQRVGLKTLLRFSPAALYRFKQEFRTLADVHHPNLVSLYELVVSETDPVFFTMELVPGTDFVSYVHRVPVPRISEVPTESGKARVKRTSDAARLGSPTDDASDERARPAAEVDSDARIETHGREREGGPEVALLRSGVTPASIERLRAALVQLVEGVQALHTAGKLHRDIKPSNVRVTPTGRVVLLDFGVATALPRGDDTSGEALEIVGTPRYMAPEQGSGETPTPACDWYSVGVILYESLVGRPPFSGAPVDVLTTKCTLDPIPPSECVSDVPPELDALCCALLSREPRERPTGPEILRRLGAKVSSRPVPVAAMSEVRLSLVGREPHVRALREAFEATRRGHSITIRVPGAAGLGKSTLVHHFIDELEENSEAEVLRGRAYERESVPYKAVDAVIDALSRYLQRLADQGASLIMPRDTWALAKLFPVLRAAPGMALATEEPLADLQALRQRAFVALRELMAMLARRHPIVVFIDDVQWGDSDSAALLLEMMRPPHSPPMLLVMTFREDDEQSNAFLLETGALWPEGAEVRRLRVDPLPPEDSRRLAMALLGSDDAVTGGLADAIARESGGSPFLVEELARGAGAERRAGAFTDPEAANLTLEHLVRARLERLLPEARALLEVVSVGGRPLPLTVLRDATESGVALEAYVGMLRTERFVRTGFRDGHEIVEPSHDRIRETVLAILEPDDVRERHRQLARALEQTPGADLEALSVHLLGAGERDRAAHYAERAAEQAVTKLAFDQAARLFRATLRMIDGEDETRRLSTRLAGVLEWSGRGGEAALVYLDAAKGAPHAQRVELERNAAEQLLSCGRIDEGGTVIRGVLASIGIRTPRSALGALLSLLYYRFRLRLAGLGFQYRTPEEVSREDRIRIDALYSLGLGLSIVDVVLGACMQALHLLLALRVGDGVQVIRAASLEVGHLASEGGTEGARERAVSEIAGKLVERTGDPEGETFYVGTRAIGQFLRGRWRDALRSLDSAYERYPNHKAGWHTNAKIFAVYALYYLGEFRQQARRAVQLLAEAEQRNDLYIIVNLRTTSMVDIALVNDDPDLARNHLREAMDQWSQTGFLVQHWKAMVWAAETELYAGNGARACEILDRDQRALRRSFLLHVQFLRASTAFVRGRALVASIREVPAVRRPRVAAARRIARSLERERMPWTAALASLVTAAAENAAGNRDGAIAALEAAIHRAMLAEMPMYAWAARHRLGLLMGGADGARRTRDAEAAMSAQGVRVPARFAGMLLPGQWP